MLPVPEQTLPLSCFMVWGVGTMEPGCLEIFMWPVPVSASMLHLGRLVHILARVSPSAQLFTAMQTQIYGIVHNLSCTALLSPPKPA